MSYRVCIPTAGTGSRLGNLTKYLNKSLVGIANRPILSHLIEQFPKEVEFVIALGYKGNLVREFLELAYPDRKFFFAEVTPFEGAGSGLGLSLMACEQYLRQPFIFISCDTLVKEAIPAPDHNWMGYSKVKDLAPYRTLKLSTDKLVTNICEKGEGQINSHEAYIGLAGIFDYQEFWSAMKEDQTSSLEIGESFGLKKILHRNLRAYNFTWYDTGNPESISQARKVYQKDDNFNILEKENEAIWFVEGRVIKFSDDKKFIANRVKRSVELAGFVPQITDFKTNSYRYSMVPGEVLSKIVNQPLFENLLQHCKKFWKIHELDSSELNNFKEQSLKFYRDKTLERISLFYKNFDQQDSAGKINGIEMPKLEELVNSIDWDWLATGLPCRFHGDFHFENIIWDAHKKSFTFLDWRQDFGGDLVVGDIYYDFAKLLHGLIVSHELIARDLFLVEWKGDEINYDFHRKQILVECENYFESWLKDNGYDQKKVRILTALIYLNIAALHHYPYSLLLFALGKAMLFKELANHSNEYNQKN